MRPPSGAATGSPASLRPERHSATVIRCNQAIPVLRELGHGLQPKNRNRAETYQTGRPPGSPHTSGGCPSRDDTPTRRALVVFSQATILHAERPRKNVLPRKPPPIPSQRNL